MNPGTHDRHDRPPVDPAVLAALRRDVGQEVLHSFVRTYIDLLISRLANIEHAIGRRDCADALRDVPDLRTSSAMLGAARLAELAEALEHYLRLGEIAAASGLLPAIRTEAAAVVVTLRSVNGERAEPQPPNR
jgi:HPt (histidine-containing phosphotransfer) domain-containing protein